MKLFRLPVSLSAVGLSSVLFTFIFPSGEIHGAPGNLIINEIMQSNIDCIMDDLNEFPDSWVELYNPTSEAVNLGEYSLGIENSLEDAFRLPRSIVAPNSHHIIYCDKVGEGLHTHFRLDSGKGGSVYLWENDKVVDSVENWKKQPAPNVAYGRVDDAADTWGYMSVPTPGHRNCGTVCKEILEGPAFSVTGGVFATPISVELSLSPDAPENTTIHYTLDGSEPTADSPKYTEPFNIRSTTVVRAVQICDGYLSPRSTTHSYLFETSNLPIVSIVTDEDYFYDPTIGIYALNPHSNTTSDVRRPVNFEYFDNDQKQVLNQLVETRVKGGYSRNFPLKSLVVYANKRFGTKRLGYEFFPEDAPGIDNWKSIGRYRRQPPHMPR